MKNTIIDRFIFWIIACFMVLQFSACTCEEQELPITGVPDPFLVEDVEFGDQVINIIFNKNLETSNLILNENIFLTNENESYTGGYEAGGNLLQLYPCGDFICENLAICPVDIRLSGDTIVGLRTLDGQILDGNANGTDGGDYETTVELACNVVFCPRVISNPWAFAPSLAGDFSDLTIDSIVVNFNKPMNINSVSPEKSIFINSQLGAFSFFQNQQTISWNEAGTSFVLYNVYVGNICPGFNVNIGACDCDLTLRLTNDVIDTEGNSLDCTPDTYMTSVTVFEAARINYSGVSSYNNDSVRMEIGPFTADHILDLESVNNSSLIVEALVGDAMVIAVEDYTLEEGMFVGEYFVVINNLMIFEPNGYRLNITFKGSGNDRILNNCGQSLDNNFNSVLGEVDDDQTVEVFVF